MKNRFKIFTIILSALACFGLFSRAQAQEGDVGNGNTVEGFNALNDGSAGAFNTALGWFSIGFNDVFSPAGSGNTGVGAGSLDGGGGNFGTAIGAGALLLNLGASNNTAVGFEALLNNDVFNTSLGEDNTAVGFQAMFQNISGADNTAVGSDALFSNTIRSGLTAVGAGALSDNTLGIHNVAVGFLALTSNTTGTNNTAVGAEALEDNTTAGNNTAVGWESSESTTGGNNTTMGSLNPAGLTIGITDGHDNVTMGHNTGLGITSGSDNTIMGADAGSSFFTRDNNVYIGRSVNPPAGTFEDNTIRIGSTVSGTPKNVAGQTAVFIGNITPTGAALGQIMLAEPVTGQIFRFTSSARYKENIKPMDKASESLFSLKPVTFLGKNDAKRIPQFGLIAEEVAKVNPNLVIRDAEGRPDSVIYEHINAMLLNEFLKEHKKVEAQQATISELKNEVQTVVAQLKEQAAQIQKVSAQVEMSKHAPQVVVNKP